MDAGDLEERYGSYLRSQEKTVHALLAAGGYADLPCAIRSRSPVGGYRARVKCIIEAGSDSNDPGLVGFDPIRGRGPFEETGWILPSFGRRIARDIFGCLRPQLDEFPVDGFELQLVHGTEEAHVMLAAKRTAEVDYAPCAQELLRDVAGLSGVAIPSQDVTLGDTFLPHNILGETVFAHYGAFFQAHYYLAAELAAEVRKLAGAEPVVRLLDLYCGVGLYSRLIGSNEMAVVGVDSGRMCIESARRNAGEKGLGSAKYHRMHVERFLDLPGKPAPDLVIVNPPRSGCGHGVIRAIADLKPRRVIAVSCSPVTHAEDLDGWALCGYRPTSIAAFDMFPFTRFLETVTLLAA